MRDVAAMYFVGWNPDGSSVELLLDHIPEGITQRYASSHMQLLRAVPYSAIAAALKEQA